MLPSTRKTLINWGKCLLQRQSGGWIACPVRRSWGSGAFLGRPDSSLPLPVGRLRLQSQDLYRGALWDTRGQWSWIETGEVSTRWGAGAAGAGGESLEDSWTLEKIAQRRCRVFLGGLQDPAARSPEKVSLKSALTLVWVGSWMGWPLRAPAKLNFVIFKTLSQT